MRKFINYLKESWTELTKKVTWPTWDKLQASAGLVLVATLILAVVIFIIDFAFQHLMELIYSLYFDCSHEREKMVRPQDCRYKRKKGR